MLLRLRLALVYSAVMVLLLAIFSSAVFFVQTRVTLEAAKNDLAQAAQHIDEAAHRTSDALSVPVAYDTGRMYIQTRGADGAVANRSANLPVAELPLSDEAREALARGRSAHETQTVDGEPLLIYSQPLNLGGEQAGVLQVALPLHDRNRALRTLAISLLLGSAGAGIAALFAGWIAADLALRPINRLTGIARDIGKRRDFSRRVEYSGPADEIGRLAATFNSMLAELQAAQLDLENTLQAQRSFLADASHELRTPLTSLRGNMDLLRRDPPIPEADRSEILEDMAAETDRLIRLVNDLLALARADAHPELRREPVLLAPLLEDLGRQARLLAPERAINWEAPGDLAALGDPDAVRQVLLILIDNALKHTPSTARVSVTASPQNGQVVMQVQDTGPGIERAALARLFDRFYRGDGARSSPGTGLGLPIAKLLVESQQGSLRVDSQVGTGSTFTATLPRAGA
jgi:two-component system, OmpR family, sensor kinase